MRYAPPDFRQRQRDRLAHGVLVIERVVTLIRDAEIPWHDKRTVENRTLVITLLLNPLLEKNTSVSEGFKDSLGEHCVGIGAFPNSRQNARCDAGTFQNIFWIFVFVVYGKSETSREQVARQAITMAIEHVGTGTCAVLATRFYDSIQGAGIRGPDRLTDFASLYER